MSITKQFLADKLIEGYVITPPTLKEQTLTQLAIQLCQYVDLKKDIICSSEQIPAPTKIFEFDICYVWDEPVAKRSNAICESLSIPSKFKSELVFRIWLIAQELFGWNKKHQALLRTPPGLTDQFLIQSDWTVEGRLDDRKIACRLVQDERISICQRYQLACVYCLESYIALYFNQIPLHERPGLYLNEITPATGSMLVELWTIRIARNVDPVRGCEEIFLLEGLKEAIEAGATTAVIYFWNALNEDKKQEIVVKTAMNALQESIYNTAKLRWMWSLIWSRELCGRFLRPTNCADILYFLYSQMNESQKIQFLFQTTKIYDKYRHLIPGRFFEVFLQWPYQDFFKSIINKLCRFLHVDHFRDILLMLACNYANKKDSKKMDTENLDYEYGGLLVELLQQAPDQYKRYLFQSGNIHSIAELLLALCSKPLFASRDITIIKKVLQHATVEEKNTFKGSEHAKNFCKDLIKCENWVLLDSLLTECVPGDSIADFKNECLQSNFIKELCDDLITRDNEEPFQLFLNWMFSSLEEISEFKSKLVSECDFYLLATQLNLNHLNKLMQRCLQSDEARKDYKEKCIKREVMFVCISLITCSEWAKFIEFLNWCFPSEDAFEEFKQHFFIEMGTSICSSLMLDGKLEIVEHFYKWYNLSYEAILQLKNEIFYSFEFLSQIYIRLGEEGKLEDIARCLKWVLADEEAVLTCKKAFDEVKLECILKIHNYDRDKDLEILTIQRWDKLIEERLNEISVALRNIQKELDELQDESIPCKKYRKQKK